jgi:hypothetical protein
MRQTELGGEGSRPQHGIGPFTGGQLAAVLIAAIVVVGLPVGAFAAVSTSAVFISGPAGVHANVDASGGLQVSGPPPSATVQTILTLSDTSECGVMRPPSGKALILTGVNVTPTGATAGNPARVSVLADPSACRAGGTSNDFPIFQNEYGTDHSEVVTLPPGIGLAHGQVLFVGVNGSARVVVYGYEVPASECAGSKGIPSAVPAVRERIGCV